MVEDLTGRSAREEERTDVDSNSLSSSEPVQASSLPTYDADLTPIGRGGRRER
jgi:hypothetical protein